MYGLTNEYAYVIFTSLAIAFIGLKVAQLTDDHDMGLVTIFMCILLICVISIILK